MRDEKEAVEAAGLVVFGISFDSLAKNKSFAEKEGFPFLLLSDVDKKVGKLYGASRPLVPMAKRISYVIGEDGKVLLAYPGVDPKTHLDVILADLKKAG